MSKFNEKSIPAMFQNRAEKYGNKSCVSCKSNDSYSDLSWNSINDMVKNLSLFLISRGIKKGDAVAIFAENRYEWWVADQAILSTGAADVPIYSTNSAEEARFILEHSSSKICFTGTREHLQYVLSVKDKLPELSIIISLDNITEGGSISVSEALKEGAAYSDRAEFEKRITAIDPEDNATFIYTSGTTGNPKGVVLTHNNFISNVKQSYDAFKNILNEDDIFLSFLPLSHSLERTIGYYLPVFVGAKVAFAESFQKILQDFQMVRPTVIISVPRLYEKMHSGVLFKAADASPVKKALLGWALKIARKNLKYECSDIRRNGLFARKFNLADKLIFSKLKIALGLDKIRISISGGGPLSVTDAEFFIGMGLKIYEGFGLTETSPVTNVNRPGKIKVGTVGPALIDTVVKISDEGEILFKGPQVMKGYYKDPESTRQVFTDDGFFKSGDIGYIDEDGYLSITGRIKDIIVTAGGKNISPQNIENSLKSSIFIEQAAVIGDRRKYLTALIVPVIEEIKKWAIKNNIQFNSVQELIDNEKVVKFFDDEISVYMKNFARVEQIRKFKLLTAEWSQETGELTPKQSVKRRVIEEKYASEIESMYKDED